MRNDSILSKFLDKLQRKIGKETEISLTLEVHTQEPDKTIIENQCPTFDSIENIQSLNANLFDANTAYLLQRKATEFKKNKQMDLAIACLMKSNEIMKKAPSGWQKKDFMRLVEYLKYDRQFDEAKRVEENLQKELPQIFSPTKTKNSQIAQCSTNLISFHSSRLCPYCSIYNQRVFSINGKDNKYPSFDILPQELKYEQCPECNTFIGFSSVYYISNKEALQDQKFSNRPFIDSRTQEEKDLYNKNKQNKIQQQKDKKDYDWLFMNLPEICPKSFGAYRKMSNAKSAKYQQLIIAAKDKGYEI